MSGRPGRLVAVLSVLILLLFSELGIVHVSGISNVDHSSCIDSGTCKAKPGVTKVTEDASRQQGSPAATTNGAPPTDGVQSSLPDRPEALAEPTEPTSTVPTPQPDVGLANTTLPDAFKEPTEGRNSTDERSATTGGQEFSVEPAAGGEPGAPADGEAVPVEPALEEEEDEDRHNFALAKDGAKVVATNKEAKKAGALLDNDADTFLKNECKADKWVIVELSQVTKMDTLLISQNELYSSRIKEFEVRGRQSHPRAEGSDYAKSLNSSAWQLLGRFNASNAKGSQAFKLERPAWIKFLQLHLLSHYGTEAVCALNALCVYGKSAAEDLEARLHLTPEAEEGEPQASEAQQDIPLLEPLPELPQPVVASNSSESGPQPVKELAADTVQLPSQQTNAESSTADADTPAATAHGDGDTVNITLPTQHQLVEGMDGAQALPQGKPSEVPDPGLEVLPQPEHGSALREPETASQSGDEQLPSNSAGSAASRHGGSLYDMIVQELKAIKLQQKAGARTLAQLQRNMTAVMGGFALELDRITARLRRIDPEPPALMSSPASTSLDFRDQQCRAPPANVTVVKPPSELELLQLEVAALREMVQQSKRQADGMLLALAFSLLGGIGLSFAVGRHGRLPSILLCCTAVPPALAAAFWVAGGLSVGKVPPTRV